MALSKSMDLIVPLTSNYFEYLYTYPLRTKAITSCVMGMVGNYLSQTISGRKVIDGNSLCAYGAFGLFIGGPVPHYFYKFMYSSVKNPILFMVIERWLYTPLYHALTLYMLALFEGSTHENAVKQVKKLYWPVFHANIYYFVLLQIIKWKSVPPIIRMAATNLISFVWIIHLAQKRSKQGMPQ